MFAHEEIFDGLVKYRYLLIAIAVLLGGCYVAISFGKNYVRGELLNGPLPIAYAWFAILALFAGEKKWGNKRSKFAAFMNKKNLWNLSFYTYKDNVNVSELAASMGGGGHVKAAGASNLPELPEFLRKGLRKLG